jgi:Mitochondrial small ribosomal subunit Rsm22
LAWKAVHANDIENANEFTVVTQIPEVSKALIDKEEGIDLAIRKELPSPMTREGNNFDVVICTHGLSDIAATARASRMAQDSLVRDLWERVSPYGGVLVVIERGTPKGFDLVGRARDVVLRTVRNEPIVDEDPIKIAMRQSLEATFRRILSREAGEEGEGTVYTELGMLLEDDPREALMEKLDKDLVEEPPSEGIMDLQAMAEEIRQVNESEDPYEIVRRIEKLCTTPVRLFKALRIVVKEELQYGIEMSEAHAQPPPGKAKNGKPKKRTRAEVEEMDAIEQDQTEKLEKLRKLEDFARTKIKQKKDEDAERKRQFERENAPGVTPEGDTFFSTSHLLPTDPTPVYTDADLKLPPPLTPSAVALPTFPVDTLSLIPAPPRHAHIIAPCPHDGECPMYASIPHTDDLIKFTPREKRKDERLKVFNRRMEAKAAVAREKKGIQGAGDRKWWCHFTQKLQDPQVFRLHGDRRGDDGTDLAKFSYVVLRKGVERPKENEHCLRTEENPDIREELVLYGREMELAAYSWPRLVAPPLKNPKHVILDVCSPLSVREPREPSLERFTITKAQGKQVYYDARKIKWGDLWAFGSRKPGIKREVIFKQNMRGRGRIGLRRTGDVEEQIEMRDEDLMYEDEETSAWVQRKLGRMQKVQKKEERREAKRALRAAGGELR